jgi:hypothetical protein
VLILAILSTPYLYFGWKILVINLACATYNLGVNIPLLLFAGSYNKKNWFRKSPFMNYQERSDTVDRWITANVSSCIDFYGIEINKYR